MVGEFSMEKKSKNISLREYMLRKRVIKQERKDISNEKKWTKCQERHKKILEDFDEKTKTLNGNRTKTKKEADYNRIDVKHIEKRLKLFSIDSSRHTWSQNLNLSDSDSSGSGESSDVGSGGCGSDVEGGTGEINKGCRRRSGGTNAGGVGLCGKDYGEKVSVKKSNVLGLGEKNNFKNDENARVLSLGRRSEKIVGDEAEDKVLGENEEIENDVEEDVREVMEEEEGVDVGFNEASSEVPRIKSAWV